MRVLDSQKTEMLLPHEKCEKCDFTSICNSQTVFT
uniref:Uncharacterized protein n=1 Tax=Anguilla anguilla TaxID=7936 RepID=A0A0E9R9D1_ANGAN